MAMMSWGLGILLIVISCVTTNAVQVCIDAKNPCLYMKLNQPGTPSGTYHVGTAFGKIIEVYCDMETDGGGFTFINPTYLARLTSDELSLMFTNKTSLRFVYRKTDSTQFGAILKQLPQYSTIPLKVGLSENAGYNNPVNQNILGNPYLYFGFLPIKDASNRNVQGMQVNGVGVTFTNCDSNPNSHITLFPNFSGITPSGYLVGSNWPFCNSIFSNSVILPTRLRLPDFFFVFAEFHWGGCGCYLQSNRVANVIGVTIGFR